MSYSNIYPKNTQQSSSSDFGRAANSKTASSTSAGPAVAGARIGIPQGFASGQSNLGRYPASGGAGTTYTRAHLPLSAGIGGGNVGFKKEMKKVNAKKSGPEVMIDAAFRPKAGSDYDTPSTSSTSTGCFSPDPLQSGSAVRELTAGNSWRAVGGADEAEDVIPATRCIMVVCSLCVPLDCSVLFKVKYSSRRRTTEEDFPLSVVAAATGLYEGGVNVPLGVFEGKIVISPSNSGTPYEEFYARRGYFYRTFYYSENTMTYVVVVKDMFTKGFTYGYNISECPEDRHMDGWNRLIGYLAVRQANDTVEEFSHNLKTLTADAPSFSAYYVKSTVMVQTLWDSFLESVKLVERSSPTTLLKFCYVVDRLRSLVPLNPAQNDKMASIFFQFSASDMLQILFSVNMGSSNLADTLLGFVDQICLVSIPKGNSQCVPWALMLNIFRVNSKCAKDAFEKFPEVVLIHLNHFLAYMPEENVSLIFCAMRTVRELADVSSVITSPKGLYRHVMQILTSSRYQKPVANSEQSLQEFESILHFAKMSPDLHNTLFEPTTKEAFRMQQISVLSVAALAKIALYPAIYDDKLNMKFKNRRIDEFIACVRGSVENGISGDGTDANPSLELYGVLSDILETEIANDVEYVRKIHSLLPSQPGSGLIARLEAYSTDCIPKLLEIEREALLSVCRGKATDPLVVRDYIIQNLIEENPNRDRLIDLVSVLWREFVVRENTTVLTAVEQGHLMRSVSSPEDYQNNLIILILTSTTIREATITMKTEASQHPELLSHPLYAEDYATVGQALQTLSVLADNITCGRLLLSTLEFLNSRPFVASNLSLVITTFDTRSVKALVDKVFRIRSEWTDVLAAFRDFMPEHPRFRACSAQQSASVLSMMSNLHNQLILDWSSPTIGGHGMRQLADKLKRSRDSMIYQWLWRRQCEREQELEVSTVASEAVLQWKESIERSFTEWTHLIRQIVNRTFQRRCLLECLESVFEDEPRIPEIPNDSVRASDVAERHRRHIREHREDRVTVEVNTTFSVLDGLAGVEKTSVKQCLLDFLKAVDFFDDAVHLLTLAELQGCALERTDALVKYVAVLRSEDGTVSEVTSTFQQALSQYPKMNLILKGFPGVLLALVKERDIGQYGLLELFSRFVSLQLLNQMIARIIAEVDDRMHGVLVAFQGVREAFSIDINGKDHYLEFCTGRLNNPFHLFDYLASVSWCITGLRRLTGSLDGLMGVFNDGVSSTSTIRLVHLLIQTGWFTVSLPDAKLSVTYIEPDSRCELHLNAVQLGDIPFQLCLTGNTRSGQDDDDDLGVHSEQKHFLRFMELLGLLADVLLKLSTAGHPKFQNRKLVIPGTETLDELEALVHQQKGALNQWHEFLAVADKNLPLLTCFTRKQLVTSIQVLSTRSADDPTYTRDTLVSLFRSVYPSHAESATEGIMSAFLQNSALGEIKLSEVAKSVHDLLKKGVGCLLPATYRSTREQVLAVSNFVTQLPERLKSPKGVSVLKLPKDLCYSQSEAAVALYVSLFSRLPAVIEVYSCFSDTTELEVADFIRRWAAATSFAEFLPRDQRKLMFCIFNTEKLKPNVQNVVLTKVHEYRKKAVFPLILITAPSTEQEATISAGLRGDVVPDSMDFVQNCLPVCSTFVRANCTKVEMFASRSPSAGKTTSILEKYVVPDVAGAGVARESQSYARLPVTGDMDEIVKLLSKLETERRQLQLSREGVVLHLNVANTLNADLINRFIFMFIITRVIFDSNGNYIVRRSEDTVAIEWPSEGVIADLALEKCRLCQSFLQHSFVPTVRFLKYNICPFNGNVSDGFATLHKIVSEEDANLKIGTQMMLAFYRVPTNTYAMPYQKDISSVIIPNPQDLYTVIEGKLTAPGASSVTPAVVFRYLRFISNQLVGLHNMWLYQMCTPDAVAQDTTLKQPSEGHVRNFLRLAYHFARCSHLLALDLAASAVGPMAEEYIESDTRLEKLAFTFSDWKEKNLLIFSGDGMPQMINTSGDIFLDAVCSSDPDADFRKFLEIQHGNQGGTTVDAMCCGLSNVDYNPVENQCDDHSLRRLLAMIGEVDNFGWHIFEALKLCTDGKHPEFSIDSPITNIKASALEALRMISVQTEMTSAAGDTLSDSKTVGDFIDRARVWFSSICGSYNDSSPPFVLTSDNLCRLLAIKLRLVCKIPVVFMGETGCGKTHAVSFYSRVCGSLFRVVNIHGGMTPSDLLQAIQEIIITVNGKPVVVLLDEVNSMPCVWTVKELVCEGFILGQRIPDNIRFICIMNPRRRRLVQSSGGLDYSPYQSKTRQEADDPPAAVGEDELPLVYEVHRSPESIMSLVWDFGIPSESVIVPEKARQITHERTPFPACVENIISDELIFAENMLHWMISAKLKHFNHGIDIGLGRPTGLCIDFNSSGHSSEAHYRFLRAVLCAVIERSQKFMREVFQDSSAASLRDIQRTISLIPFLITAQRRLVEVDPASGRCDKHLYFTFLSTAVQITLTMNYGLRLNGSRRQEYYRHIRAVWEMVRSEHAMSLGDNFLPVPMDADSIYRVFDRFAKSLCDRLSLEDGMAVNEALKENVASLFCSIMGNQDTGIAQFIVGRPGSSKSSSLDILCASTDPNSTDPRCKFFKTPEWFEVRKFVLQCTPDTTAADILRVARSAANYQSINDKCRCVIVLEEVGVTVGSMHNPLMVLHGLVDRGVLMDNGSYIRLPVVGVSNWKLDASKMNRMRSTHRGNPSVNDLMLTAECIIQSKSNGVGAARFDETFNVGLKRFAQEFSNFVLGSGQASNDIKRLGWFYGMRDFYAFVQLLQSQHSMSLAKEMGMAGSHVYDNNLDPHLVRWATKLAFGGHPDSRLEDMLAEKINNAFFYDACHVGQVAKWKRSEKHGEEVYERYLCDMCGRVCYYTDVKVSHAVEDGAAHRRRVFDEFMIKADRSGFSCSELDSADRFPTLKLLSFLLHVPLSTSRNYCRMRHVLLFTKANAALHLLHSLDIVRRRNVVIVFGRKNATSRDILDDLLRVRRCMLSGKVLILVGAKHLYESMYDSLNQHYSVEGEGENKKYYTRLTMNGYTASFPIHSSFRCIAIEQADSASELLPPFINRFAKAHLNYYSALSVPQRNLVVKIQGNSFVPVGDGTDILTHLIPGLTDDTFHSLAFLFSADLLKSTDQFRRAEECAVAKLAFLCSPRRMQHLSTNLFELFAGQRAHEIIRFWNVPRTHTLKGDFTFLAEGFKFSDEVYQHLYLLTEQRCLDFRNVCDNVMEVFGGSVPAKDDFVNLNMIASDGEVTAVLASLCETTEASFIVALCDMTHQNAADHVERFVYLVNTLNVESDKHVVLIAMVRNSAVPNTPLDKFHLHFDHKWCYLFLDEIDTSEQYSQITLEMMLSPDAADVGALLAPPFMNELVLTKSLSIAQKIDPTNNHLETVLKQIELSFGQGSFAAEIVCTRICGLLLGLDSVNNGGWRLLSLKKIRQTHTLREQFYLFLAAFVERCLLQFATPLFKFGNFVHSLPGSPFEQLFCLLLQSDIIVPPPDLTLCPMVDLPLTVEWMETASTDLMFDGEIVKEPVKFPFAFLIYSTLQPVAVFGGENALETKLQEILHSVVLSAEESEAYATDILVQKGLNHSTLHHALISIVNASLDINVQGSISKLHYVLEAERKSLEAAVRFVTNPSVRLHELSCPDLRHENLREFMVRACTDNAGIVDLGSIYDISILAGDSFGLQLHQAVAAASSSFTYDKKVHAADLARRCQENHHLLINEFVSGSDAVIELSKFLIPVLFRHVTPSELMEVTVQLLNCMYRKYNDFPKPATGYLVRKALEIWLRNPDSQSVLDALDATVNLNGADSEPSVLISKVLFDLCVDVDTVLAALAKAALIPNDGVRPVLLTGAVTIGLQYLCDRLKGAVTDQEDFISLPQADILSNQIQSVLSLTESTKCLIDGAAAFVLRSLSSCGVEIDLARTCLQADKHRTIPGCIFGHELLQQLVQPKDKVPSIMCLFDDYSRAIVIVRATFLARETTAQHLTQFESCCELGAAAALLDLGFCYASDRSAAEINSIRLFLQYIQRQELREFTTAVVNSAHTALLEIPRECRKAWICAVLIILTSPNPVCHYFAKILRNDGVLGTVPFPDIPGDVNLKLGTHVHRFLHAASALASACLAPQVAIDTVKVGAHRDHIFNEILITKCPCCSRPMDFWPGCFAVVCECGGNFCGWCFTATGGDAHPHVLTCPNSLQPGSYWGTDVLYYQVRNESKLAALKRYLDNTCSQQIRTAVLAACLPQLNTLNISTDSLGATAEGYSFELCAQRLIYAGSFIKAHCFSGSLTDDPAFVWLQGLCVLHLKERAEPCSNDAEIKNCLLQMLIRSGSAVSVVDAIRTKALQSAGSSNAINGVLSWDDNYDSSVRQMSDAERRMSLPHHFAYRRPFTESMFRHRIINDPELSLLSYLQENAGSLDEEYSSRVVNILDYVGDLVRICYAKQITSAMASEISLGDVSAEYHYLGGARLHEFCENLNFMYQYVQRYECKGRAVLEGAFGHLVFNETLPVSYLLPRSTPDGVSLTPVIYKGVAPNDPPISWQSLGYMQNNVVLYIRSKFAGCPERAATNRPFKLSMAEVATFDIDRDLYDNLSLFIEPSPVSRLTNDIGSLQHMVAHSLGLWGKPTICDELPQFKYSDEHRKSVFGNVVKKFGIKLLKPKMQNVLRLAAEQNPEFADSVVAFLTLVAVEILNRSAASISPCLSDIARSIIVPLTFDQESGRTLLSSPVFERELQTAHLVAICAQIWDGAVIDKAAVPLEFTDADELRQMFSAMVADPIQKLVVPSLRLGLRLLGIQFMCTAQTDAFLSANFMVYLEGILGDDCDDFLFGTCLARIPVLHFQDVFTLAESILSEVVQDDAATDGKLEFEVPLSKLRPTRAAYFSPQANNGHMEPVPDPAGGGGVLRRVGSRRPDGASQQSIPQESSEDGEAVPTGPPRRFRWEGDTGASLSMD
jgi:hypothetical protein